MYYVYVLINPKGILYKGSTPRLAKRLEEHNNGTYDSYTGGKGPWELVHLEKYDSMREALARERYLKTGKGREYLKKHFGESSRGRAIGSSQGS